MCTTSVAKPLTRIKKFWSAYFERSRLSIIVAVSDQRIPVKSDLSRNMVPTLRLLRIQHRPRGRCAVLVLPPDPLQSLEGHLVVHRSAKVRTASDFSDSWSFN